MRILPLPSSTGHPACQILCQALPVRLHVSGLAAGDLQTLFQATGPLRPWRRPPLPAQIVIDNPDAGPALADAPLQALQLGADRVELGSGRAARLFPGCAADTAATHFPQSLYLCLAQQWARSGVFALHAAGIVAAGRGILALGERMAGKSTLALSALAAGHQVVSDDWLLLGPGADGRAHIERLRGYLALRAGRPRERLLPRSGLAVAAGSDGNGQRQLFTIDGAAPARFPATAAVHHLWLLQPGPERPGSTRLMAAAAATALAGLVAAAMPLLLSTPFPAERQALMGTANRLLAQAAAAQVSTGSDLVRAPEANWERLLKTLAFAPPPRHTPPAASIHEIEP